jgi:hypothetical protein
MRGAPRSAEAAVAITSISQFEAILGDITKLADKVSYATSVSTKFEEARRIFKEMLGLLKTKEPLSKLFVQKFSKACDTMVTDLGHMPGILDKLYDLQDYLQYNPPA